MSIGRQLRRFAYVGQSALRGALAGLLLGVTLGATGTVASVAGRPELQGAAGEALWLAVVAGSSTLGLLGGVLGAFVGLCLTIGGKHVTVQRLSALYLTALVAALPPVLTMSWLPLLESTSLGQHLAAQLVVPVGLASLATGLVAAVALHGKINRVVVRVGAHEGPVVYFATGGLLIPCLLFTVSSLPKAGSLPGFGALAPGPSLAARSSLSAGSAPNVLLITVDTLRADRLGSYGQADAVTPHLDRLASEGARFEWAIVQQPQTNAQHASLFTGLYPATHGVRIHMVNRLPDRFPTLAQSLKTAGYVTTGIYSWISLEPAFSGLQRGFDSYQGYVVNRPEMLADGRLQYLAAGFRRLKEYLAVVRTADLVLKTSDGLEDKIDGRADVTTDAALEWLQTERHDRPFFLWVHYFDPHYPYAPPPPYDRTYDPDYGGTLDGGMATIRSISGGRAISERDRQHLVALYDGEIAYVDAEIGRLLGALEEHGRLDDTIVILTGDHGESFAEHGWWFHGGALYNTETRVPLLIRYPKAVPQGVVITAPVQGVDLMPTILDLTGMPTPRSVQGQSLVPLIADTEHGGAREAFSQLPDDHATSIVRDGWKLIRDRASGSLELYHLASDPDEMYDLALEQPTVASDLEARLRRWMAGQGMGR